MPNINDDKKEKVKGSLPASLDDTDIEESEEIESIVDSLDGIPDDVKNRVKKLVVQQESFGMMGIGRFSQENEIAKKINAEHISNYLDGAKAQMHNEYKERHENKIYTTILVFFALIFFIVVIVLLKDDKDILEKIIYSITALVAGAFGGYGFGRHKNQDSD